MHILHIVTFMDSLSGFELSSDEDEPSLRPENPDDIESYPMQPPLAMIGPLPEMLPQQPVSPLESGVGPFKRAHWDHNPLH